MRKRAFRPLSRSPLEGRASPSFKHPPMGRRDGSLHLLPKPILPSRKGPAGRFHREIGPAALAASSWPLIRCRDRSADGRVEAITVQLRQRWRHHPRKTSGGIGRTPCGPRHGHSGAEIGNRHRRRIGIGSRPAVQADDAVPFGVLRRRWWRPARSVRRSRRAGRRQARWIDGDAAVPDCGIGGRKGPTTTWMAHRSPHWLSRKDQSLLL